MKVLVALLVLSCLALVRSDCVIANGTHVAEGTAVKPNPCEFCTCRNGHLACAIMDCAFPPCDNYVTLPGHCCPTCPSG